MIIAWQYEADTHCPACAKLRFGSALRDPAREPVDAEGNRPHPVWDFDQWCDEDQNGEVILACCDCATVIDRHEHDIDVDFDDFDVDDTDFCVKCEAPIPGGGPQLCEQCEQAAVAASILRRNESAERRKRAARGIKFAVKTPKPPLAPVARCDDPSCKDAGRRIAADHVHVLHHISGAHKPGYLPTQCAGCAKLREQAEPIRVTVNFRLAIRRA